MELINYIVSLFLIIITIYIKFNPNTIKLYRTLDEKQKKRFSMNTLFWGLLLTAFLIPVIAYNIRFVGYHDAANWSFIISLFIGVLLTYRAVKKKLTKD